MEMKEYPILFTAPMVRAIIEGRKTQTRRIITLHNSITVPQVSKRNWDAMPWEEAYTSGFALYRPILSVPFRHTNVQVFSRIHPGDRLWVKESWAQDLHGEIFYRVDHEGTAPTLDGKWRSALFMPRGASRLSLDVVSVRSERIQEISEEDAHAEGADNKAGFQGLWNSINEARGFGWDVNPRVWVYDFRRAK